MRTETLQSGEDCQRRAKKPPRQSRAIIHVKDSFFHAKVFTRNCTLHQGIEKGAVLIPPPFFEYFKI